MKNIFFAAAAFAAASSVFAQQPPKYPGPTGKDRMLLLSPDQMPLPLPNAELLKMQGASLSKADDGFSILDKSSDKVRQFFNNLEIVKTSQSSTPQEAEAFAEALKTGRAMPTAPMVVKSLEDLKVGFNPASVRSGKLIGVAPQGTIVNGKWTGVERYFRIDGSGYSRVSETDMAASGGMFYMNKSAVNTTVAGKPAISMVLTNDQGHRIEEVLWVDGGKLYTVTYAPDQQPGRYGMMKTNSAVSALSLATELR